MRFAFWCTVDRHGLSALAMTRGRKGLDDKVWYFYHEGSEVVEFSHCHCEEGVQVTDAAIHRVSGRAGGFVCSVTGLQWIATGFALAMTKGRVRFGY